MKTLPEYREEISVSETISKKTLEDMDSAVANVNAGNVSETIELSDFQ